MGDWVKLDSTMLRRRVALMGNKKKTKLLFLPSVVQE